MILPVIVLESSEVVAVSTGNTVIQTGVNTEGIVLRDQITTPVCVPQDIQVAEYVFISVLSNFYKFILHV